MFERQRKSTYEIINENKKALTEKDFALTEKDQLIEELQRKLNGK